VSDDAVGLEKFYQFSVAGKINKHFFFQFYSFDTEQNGNNNDKIEGFLLNVIIEGCRRAEQNVSCA
jgi:hypothetical protein